MTVNTGNRLTRDFKDTVAELQKDAEFNREMMIDQLTEQRDELLAALKDLIERALADTGNEPSHSMLHRSIDQAREIIAEAGTKS